jgi:serine/threonine protein kinase
LSNVAPEPSPVVAAAAPSTKQTKLPSCIGRFEVRGRLGAGGFGIVYRGYDPQLKRDVAIKVAKVRGEITDDVVTVLDDEASRLAQFDDPRLARVYEIGQTAEKGPFVVMQYCEGARLTEWIKEHHP